ncbi:lytic transglycosylase [Steroidobacter agaridevorans]|uniref:Lytic transglycosylase n=1 Tax=Steroidobacter agaridevorans TaxID=2695856 RepID=A0A829YGE9_9GAMM|nr:LysM peptidoglycan-binding domain-containing protein [Steroidobacter agaridevorans]GFE81993.1 lytic transglycosylase [Steroidobacter agaridevorans]GFE85618.1 lytic transglycosylase [Steroidobacter agaridevorans]
MFQWRPATALPAILATTLVVLTAGCSHLGSNDDSDADDEDPVEFVELDPAITKLDEAAIGVSGPEQIEEAIEALDQTGPRLVRELGQDGAALPEGGDLFERIRKGYTLSDIDHPSVEMELRWFVKHPDYLDRTFKRGERYLHHIVGELEARNMPLELALLPVVESAFNPVAYSRARASGLWQFISETGRRYGLKQNWYYDGRRDVIASTSAALDYLQFLHDEFDGDWLLAVAAYNCGEARVAREVAKNARAGKPTDYFSLKLPRETRAYVPKLLAMRRIVGDPTSHGLAFAPIANAPYFVKVDVGGQLDLHVAAELADLSKEEILALNPAFNHWITDPDGPHHILVPIDRNDRFKEGIAALPPSERVRVVYHRVRRGDTLGEIADKYGISVAAIKNANKIRGSMIHPGQELLIAAAPKGVQLPSEAQLASYEEESPARSRAPSDKHIVRRGDTLWSIAKTHGVSMNRLANSNGLDSDDTLSIGQVLAIPGTARLAATDSSTVARSSTYVVRRGDSLSTIATKFRVRLTDLLGWNNLTKRSVIKPGQRLVMYIDDRRRAGI